MRRRMPRSDALWELFDGDREHLNIAHECINRHADGSGRAAVRIAHADGARRDPQLRRDRRRRRALRALAGRARASQPGDRIAFMLEPSLPFYVCLFGAMKTGAISGAAVHAVRPRRAAAAGRRLQADDPDHQRREGGAGRARSTGPRVVVADDGLLDELAQFPATYTPQTSADDLAVFQYTSGTTRELPEAVKHTHRALVTLMFAALYGTGIRPGDEFFCPSSPAWGHGLWHGTLAPLALGVTTGTFAGRFDAVRLMQALQDYRITNMSAAATHYRMMKNSGQGGDFDVPLPEAVLHRRADRPGDARVHRRDLPRARLQHVRHHRDRRGAGQLSGRRRFHGQAGLARQGRARARSSRCSGPTARPPRPGEIGELMLWRRDGWETTKDLAKIDEDGYFYHGGRADDVIISAGWTMSAVEIENTLLKHPDVREGARDRRARRARGQVVKAFVVADRAAQRRLRQASCRISPASALAPARIPAASSSSSPSFPRPRPARSTARSCATAKPPPPLPRRPVN